MKSDDRTVHAHRRDDGEVAAEIVRYDRAGRWALEHPNGVSDCVALTIADAVAIAVNWENEGVGIIHYHRLGGRQFDSKVRKSLATLRKAAS